MYLFFCWLMIDVSLYKKATEYVLECMTRKSQGRGLWKLDTEEGQCGFRNKFQFISILYTNFPA